MIFSTITQDELTLSVDSYNLPTQNSNNIQLKFVQDNVNYNGYTPTVAMALLDSSLVSCADVLNQGGFVPLESDGTFLVQNNILSQNGFLAVAINLTNTVNEVTENIMLGPVVYKIQANISSLSPLPTDDELWQSVVTAFVEQYLANYTTNTVQPILEQAQEASSNANQAVQTANEASQNVQTAYSNLGNYKVENGILYFMKADGTYNEQGITLAGQSTVTDANGNPILTGPLTAPMNKLVNGDFQINQRGETEYNENKDGSYTVDMWKTRQGNYSNAIKIVPKKGGGITVTLPSAGISAGINQFLPYEDTDLGKKFTAVVSIDKVRYPFTFELSTSANKTNIKEGVELSISYNNDLKCIEYRLYFANNSENNIQNIPFDVDYCDLFPGDIAYEHQKEDYSIALMRCREWVKPIEFTLYGYCTTGGRLNYFENFDIPFANTPNVTVLEAGVQVNVATVNDTATQYTYMCIFTPTNIGNTYITNRKLLLSCEPLS